MADELLVIVPGGADHSQAAHGRQLHGKAAELVVAETIFNDPASNRETLTVGINAFVGLYQTQY